MASRGVVGIALLSAIPILCLELRRGIPDLGIKDLILLCGRIFLLLALLTLIISVTTSWLTSFKFFQVYLKNYFQRQEHSTYGYLDVLCEEEKENEKRQELVRKKQQEVQGEKASRYLENVLKPQQEMKQKKLEERFYRMTGETWKLSNGHKLGSDEDLGLKNASQTSFETSNREEAERRNFPKPVTKIPLSAKKPSEKKVLDLPEEPPETAEEVPDLPEEPPKTAEEVVTVALRCLSGRVLKRRFFKSCSSQVLLDWMMKIGYHTSLYSLSNSFPRRPLEVLGSWTLEDIGITVDTVLNVEEKEQSN